MNDSAANRPSIGVALSGGAARGFAHIGALRVLVEAGIPIDYVIGTSVGSVIGAAYACGTPFEEMEKICAGMRWRDIAHVKLSKRGLVTMEKSDPFLDRLIPLSTFEQLKHRFYAVSTDIVTGEVVVISSGDLKQAVRASCAIPGLFVPVEVGERVLVDGGVSANLPVMPLRQLGAEKIILVDVSARVDSDRPPQNLIQIILQSMFIIGRLAARSAREHADVIVEPEVNGYAWDDFKCCADIVKAGEDAMRRALPIIRSWLPPRKPSRLQRIWFRLLRMFGA